MGYITLCVTAGDLTSKHLPGEVLRRARMANEGSSGLSLCWSWPKGNKPFGGSWRCGQNYPMSLNVILGEINGPKQSLRKIFNVLQKLNNNPSNCTNRVGNKSVLVSFLAMTITPDSVLPLRVFSLPPSLQVNQEIPANNRVRQDMEWIVLLPPLLKVLKLIEALLLDQKTETWLNIPLHTGLSWSQQALMPGLKWEQHWLHTRLCH